MKIVALCTLSTGLLAIQQALRLGVKIERIVGLRLEDKSNLSQISGFIDIESFCIENGIECAFVQDYTLKSENAEVLLNNADLLWVCGWQRLVPQSFLDGTRYGAIGAHGSCDGITKGRGRSPQNWALLIGAKRFEISVFKLRAGVDDGEILSSDVFVLNEFDSIQTSYIKSSIAVARCVKKIYSKPSLLSDGMQQNESAEYFPKRLPSDGAIDWNMFVTDIYNQVRGLTDPYPNAHTFYENSRIFIKRAIPIKCEVDFKPGFVADQLFNGGLLVTAADGYLLIEDYEPKSGNNVNWTGIVFSSVDMHFTVNAIRERFKKEFPEKTINSSLIHFWRRIGIEV
jgi:methionyl-tRNA formyltransferase